MGREKKVDWESVRIHQINLMWRKRQKKKIEREREKEREREREGEGERGYVERERE